MAKEIGVTRDIIQRFKQYPPVFPGFRLLNYFGPHEPLEYDDIPSIFKLPVPVQVSKADDGVKSRCSLKVVLLTHLALETPHGD